MLGRFLIILAIVFIPYIIGKAISNSKIDFLYDRDEPVFITWLKGVLFVIIGILLFMLTYAVGSWLIFGEVKNIVFTSR